MAGALCPEEPCPVSAADPTRYVLNASGSFLALSGLQIAHSDVVCLVGSKPVRGPAERDSGRGAATIANQRVRQRTGGAATERCTRYYNHWHRQRPEE